MSALFPMGNGTGVRRFLLTVGVTFALLSGSTPRADVNYRAEITGAEDSDLSSLLDKVSELKTLEEAPSFRRGLAAARRP